MLLGVALALYISTLALALFIFYLSCEYEYEIDRFFEKLNRRFRNNLLDVDLESLEEDLRSNWIYISYYDLVIRIDAMFNQKLKEEELYLVDDVGDFFSIDSDDYMSPMRMERLQRYIAIGDVDDVIDEVIEWCEEIKNRINDKIQEGRLFVRRYELGEGLELKSEDLDAPLGDYVTIHAAPFVSESYRGCNPSP